MKLHPAKKRASLDSNPVARFLHRFSRPAWGVIGAWALMLSPAWAASAPLEKPNVLMIISDDLTASSLPSYGNPICQTPHLDRLAEAGVVFRRAYSQYPVCGPSRASLMSGLYPNRTGMLRNDKTLGSYRALNPRLSDHPSIGGFLRRRGYFSARVSKIFHMGVPGGIELGEPGGDDPDSWDYAYNVLAPESFSPGRRELLSPLRKHRGSNFERVIVPDGRESTQADYMAATQAVSILEHQSRKEDPKPFFLAVGLVRPHVPLAAPQRLFDLYRPEDVMLPFVPEGDLLDVPEAARGMENSRRYGMSILQQRQAVAAYYASVSFMDEQVGRLLEALDRLDLTRNTIVIFTSDHGYNLGEHHCWQKLSLFEESVRVPLIISVPGRVGKGRAVDELVELIDLYPTLADLAGLSGEAPDNLQGRSLRPLLEGRGAGREWRRAAYTVTYQQGESIRTANWRYNRWGAEGAEELYDHREDPQEFRNLAGDPGSAGRLAEMRRLLGARRAESF